MAKTRRDCASANNARNNARVSSYKQLFKLGNIYIVAAFGRGNEENYIDTDVWCGGFRQRYAKKYTESRGGGENKIFLKFVVPGGPL